MVTIIASLGRPYIQNSKMITISSQNLQGQHLTTLTLLSILFLTASAQFTNPGCTNFTAANDCIACSDRYYLQNGICYPVSPLCNTYSNTTGACLTCFQGFELNGNACQRTTTPNCAQYNSNGVCSQCQNRYYLVNQNCIAVDVSCTTYLADGNCTGCISGFVLTAGHCYQEIANCMIQTASACQQCQSSFIRASNFCYPEILNCLSYDQQGKCLSCDANMMLVGSGAACLPPIDNCTIYNLTSGECLVCQTYFRVIQGGCAITLDPFCQTFNGSVCLQCSTRYYFNSANRCQSVSELCQTYNSTGACLSCYNGYELSGLDCIKAVSRMDPFCNIFNGTQCLKCSWGYRFDAQGSCVELDYLCWNYNITSYECLECYPGFMVGNTSRCEPINEPGCLIWANNACTSCYQGYYLHSNHCQQIDPLCQNFDLNTLTCLNCYQGYHIVNSTCEIIPANSSISSCKTVTAQGQCTSCYWGSYLTNGECREVDTLCRTFSNITGECTSCYGGYFLLQRSGKCYPLA